MVLSTIYFLLIFVLPLQKKNEEKKTMKYERKKWLFWVKEYIGSTFLRLFFFVSIFRVIIAQQARGFYRLCVGFILVSV